MRFCFLPLLVPFFTFNLFSQTVSNVGMEIRDGRVIISYDLSGDSTDHYDLDVTAIDENGSRTRPSAVVGDLKEVTIGHGRTIWWEPQLEGLKPTGWRISLKAIGIGITWVLVVGGPNGDYYVSATEITFSQYDMFCEATGYEKPNSAFGRGEQPVVNVSVADAMTYCSWLGKRTKTVVRLPEEDEWEYAARGGKTSRRTQFSGGNVIDAVAWYSGNSGNKTHTVKTKKANELGIYDMSGNVWELCGTSGAFRGGSWYSGEANCQVTSRYEYDSGDHRSDDLGFRVLQKR